MSSARIGISLSIFLATLLGFATVADASVWTVGGLGADFPHIQAGVNGVADGDILLVRKGTYPPFVIDNKDLQVVAMRNNVVVDGQIEVRNLSADRAVVLTRINGDPSSIGSSGSPGIVLSGNLGPVRVQDSQFRGSCGNNVPPDNGHPDGWTGAVISNCADVSFVRCEMVGGCGTDVWDWWTEWPVGSGGDAVYASDSNVTLYECTMLGSNGGSCLDVHDYNGGSGGTAFTLINGHLFTSKSTFTGADGGYGGDEGVFHGPGDGGDGGHGLLLWGTGTPDAWLLDNDFAGGKGGMGGYFSGAPGWDGVPVLVWSGAAHHMQGAARTFSMPNPVKEGEFPKLTFTGEVGDTVALFATSRTAASFSSALNGEWLLPLSPRPRFVGLFTITAPTGTFEDWADIRGLSAGVDGLGFYLQAMHQSITGQVFTGTPQSLLILK